VAKRQARGRCGAAGLLAAARTPGGLIGDAALFRAGRQPSDPPRPRWSRPERASTLSCDIQQLTLACDVQGNVRAGGVRGAARHAGRRREQTPVDRRPACWPPTCGREAIVPTHIPTTSETERKPHAPKHPKSTGRPHPMGAGVIPHPPGQRSSRRSHNQVGFASAAASGADQRRMRATVCVARHSVMVKVTGGGGA